MKKNAKKNPVLIKKQLTRMQSRSRLPRQTIKEENITTHGARFYS